VLPNHYDLHIKNFNCYELKFLIEYQYKFRQNAFSTLMGDSPSTSSALYDEVYLRRAVKVFS